MSKDNVLEMIKDSVTGRGFTLVAEDVSSEDYIEAESFAVRGPSGITYFVSVHRMN